MADGNREMADLAVEQYRELIEQTSDVITVVGADGTIRYQSPSSEPVKGWAPEELLGEQIFEYVHPEDRRRVAEEFSSLTGETGRIDDEIEFRFRSRDDGWIWLAVTGTAPGPESQIDGYITVSRDITERKEYERVIASERDFLETIIESLPYPFYVLEIEDYTIVRANAKATVEEGDTCYEVTHGRDQPCDQGADTAPCPINEVEGDEPVTVQHVHQDEAGNDRVFELHAAPITDEDGTVVQIAESNIEITGRVEYERRLESQRDNLELLNQIVRHDIRNDIQVISAYAEALSDAVGDGETEYIEKIRGASRDAIEITETARDITEVPEVTVSVAVDGDTARVAIADNGPGISDDRKQQVFQEGERGLDSRGSGIGLYLVETLVGRYGGDVSVADNEPTGAVFTVALPVVD